MRALYRGNCLGTGIGRGFEVEHGVSLGWAALNARKHTHQGSRGGEVVTTTPNRARRLSGHTQFLIFLSQLCSLIILKEMKS